MLQRALPLPQQDFSAPAARGAGCCINSLPISRGSFLRARNTAKFAGKKHDKGSGQRFPCWTVPAAAHWMDLQPRLPLGLWETPT